MYYSLRGHGLRRMHIGSVTATRRSSLHMVSEIAVTRYEDGIGIYSDMHIKDNTVRRWNMHMMSLGGRMLTTK